MDMTRRDLFGWVAAGAVSGARNASPADRAIASFAERLSAPYEDLSPEAAKVLRENLWPLYGDAEDDHA